MGISQDSMHKRRATGGKKKAWRKKRKYELGCQPANTNLSEQQDSEEGASEETEEGDATGQCGRANVYILEGKELEFYMKKLQRKKGKGSAGATA